MTLQNKNCEPVAYDRNLIIFLPDKILSQPLLLHPLPGRKIDKN